MKPLLLLMLAASLLSGAASAQFQQRQQYFDGADTSRQRSVFITLEADSNNIWQVGPPQKTTFNRASTIPNALVTDTINNYPQSDTSSFSFVVSDSSYPVFTRLVAIRWSQKLDMEKHHSGGVVEFSLNDGPWQNIFNNPNVYNLYGYMQANKDTLAGGTFAFSGRDTTWRDIWFCLRPAQMNDSFRVRFSFISDTSTRGGEGWMIDNLLVRPTFQHTVSQVMTEADSRVYPTQTSGVLHIEASPSVQRHEIESVRIINMQGQVVRSYNDVQSRYLIDIGDCVPGKYSVQVVSNLGKETFSVMLQK